jgi:hypothetical protein
MHALLKEHPILIDNRADYLCVLIIKGSLRFYLCPSVAN